MDGYYPNNYLAYSGLIVRFKYFNGDLTIGDSNSNTYLRDFSGFLNEYTMARFSNWSMEYANNVKTYAANTLGISSEFFNIESTTNYINYLTVQNLDFWNIYGRVFSAVPT